MKASGWSSPTWSCSSASSSVTTSFPTTSTCARWFPAVTSLLTPTCCARAPPATSPPMNQSARSRRQAAAARTRHVGRRLLLVMWSLMSHLCSSTKQQRGVKRVTWGFCLFNRIPACRSRWKSIKTPVLILMRYTHTHRLPFFCSFPGKDIVWNQF